MTLQGCYHIAVIFLTFLLIPFAFPVFLSSTFMHSLSMLLCGCMSVCLHINNSIDIIRTVYRSVSFTLFMVPVVATPLKKPHTYAIKYQ